MKTSVSARSAFTLIEMLVVTGITAVLIGILLPAVQNIRERGNRLQCQNNLKQIGLAEHNYLDTYKVFTPGYLSQPDNPAMGPVDPQFNDAGPGWGWLTMLLPYLEYAPLYNSLNLTLPDYDPANAAAVQTPLKLFRCPSDVDGNNPAPGDTVNVVDVNNNTLVVFGRSNYVQSVGSSTLWCSWPVTIYPDGPIFRNSEMPITRITDGLTYTVFAGERSSNLADSVWPGVVPFSTHFAWPPFASIGSGGLNRPYDGPGAFVGAHGGPCPYEDPVVIHPPNSPIGHSDQMESGHSGGANILMCDGAVRFYANNNPLSLWVALISRNGNEVIDDNF